MNSALLLDQTHDSLHNDISCDNKANSEEKLSEAKIFQSRNKYNEALLLYNEIISNSTSGQDNDLLIDALFGKATCLRYLNDRESSLKISDKLLKLFPNNWHAYINKGFIFKESDRFVEAIDAFQKAATYNAPSELYIEPLSAVITDYGTKFKINGDRNEAMKYYKQAISINPTFSTAFFNLGVLYSELGRVADCLKCYSAAVKNNPSNLDALLNIGVLYKNAGDLDSAIHFYQRALQINPNFVLANNNLAIALTDLGTKVKNEGKNSEAILHYKKALLHNVKYSDAWYNLGVANADDNNTDEAIICYEIAVALNPRCSHAYNNLGVIYKDRSNIEKAINCYKAALQINPLFSQTLNNLGVMYTMLGQMDEAYAMCQKAIEVNPDYADAFNNLGVLFRDEGRLEEAIASYQSCLRLEPLSRNAGQNLLLALNYLADADSNHSTVTDAHIRWGVLHFRHRGKALPKLVIHNSISQKDKILRIGYISPDFFVHSVSYFIEAPLAFFDPQKTQIYCYSNVARDDKKTLLLKSYLPKDHWHSISGLSTRSVCNLIRQDKIDILVELTGHTAANRLDVMTLAPAPIQVTWIGYPNTTGLPTIQYRITDEVADPKNTDQKFVESLFRLPTPFLCYTPSQDAPVVSITPALTSQIITFGSFNNMAKINNRVISTWAKILHAVPHSRLLLKCKPFASETIRHKFISNLEKHGISSKRIDLLSLFPHTTDHLHSYSLLDISLDTFPYAGTTTTCESLYMGVPVITLTGKVHAHNVGASLISSISLLSSICIASSPEEYVEKAVKLASNISELNILRKKIRDAMLESKLCNGKVFLNNLEEAYRDMWYEYLEQENMK